MNPCTPRHFELHPADLATLRRDIDTLVERLLNREIWSVTFHDIYIYFLDLLPGNFVEEWSQKGTWATNTVLSTLQSMHYIGKKDDTSRPSAMEVIKAQHFVQDVLFKTIWKIEEKSTQSRSTVDILYSLEISCTADVLTVKPIVKTFIVARKMWQMYPTEKAPVGIPTHHYSFGEAVAELLVTPEFDGITFLRSEEDREGDLQLTRTDVADILRLHQERIHQEAVRKDRELISFLPGINPWSDKMSPLFNEGLVGLVGGMREPTVDLIAKWIIECKEAAKESKSMPDFPEPPTEVTPPTQSPE